MAYTEIIDVPYVSPVTGSTLYYDVTYVTGSSNLPILLVMHTFNSTKSAITSEIKNRLADAGVLIVSPNTSEDCSGVGAVEVRAALLDAMTRYASVVEQNNLNINGYSGGGGMVLKLATMCPDLFGVRVSHFGMSDYGADSGNGWYIQNVAYQATIASRIGGTPSEAPDKYLARMALLAAKNYKYGFLRLYHDTGDSDVNVSHSDNIKTALDALTYSNYDFTRTTVGSPTRAVHGLPIVGDPGEPNINFESTWTAEVVAGTYKNQTLDNTGSLIIEGALFTKRFEVVLNDYAFSDVVRLDYDLTEHTYHIENYITFNDVVAAWTIRSLSPNTQYIIRCSNIETGELEKITVMTDGDGVAAFSVNWSSGGRYVVTVGDGTHTVNRNITRIFGDRPGDISSGNKDAYILPSASHTSRCNNTNQFVGPPSYKGLDRVNFSGFVPTNQTVVSLTLSKKVETKSGAMGVIFRRITSTHWGVTRTQEGTSAATSVDGQPTAARAEDRGGVGDVSWAGATFAEASDCAVAERTVAVPNVGERLEADLSIMGQAWVSSDDDNKGVAEIGDTAATNSSFSTRTHGTTANRPFWVLISKAPLVIYSVSITGTTLTITGSGFLASGATVETSPAGAGTFTAVDSVDSQADGEILATATGLAAGSYDVRVTNTDGEAGTKSGAFVVSAATVYGFGFRKFGFGF